MTKTFLSIFPQVCLSISSAYLKWAGEFEWVEEGHKDEGTIDAAQDGGYDVHRELCTKGVHLGRRTQNAHRGHEWHEDRQGYRYHLQYERAQQCYALYSPLTGLCNGMFL